MGLRACRYSFAPVRQSIPSVLSRDLGCVSRTVWQWRISSSLGSVVRLEHSLIGWCIEWEVLVGIGGDLRLRHVGRHSGGANVPVRCQKAVAPFLERLGELGSNDAVGNGSGGRGGSDRNNQRM